MYIIEVRQSDGITLVKETGQCDVRNNWCGVERRGVVRDANGGHGVLVCRHKHTLAELYARLQRHRLGVRNGETQLHRHGLFPLDIWKRRLDRTSYRQDSSNELNVRSYKT